MPPQEPVQGVAKLIYNGASGGVQVANVMHWAKDSRTAFTQGEIGALATAARSNFVQHFIPHIHPDYALGSVDAIDLTSEVGVVAAVGGSTPGTAAGARLPSSAAVCITWKISRRYRGGHPRTYLAPPGDVVLTASPNTWDPDFVTAIEGAALAFRNALNTTVGGAPGELVCVHRYRTNSEGIREILKPPLVDVYVDSSVDTRVDSQRRRLGPDRG